jgi:hypothetical protein
LSLTIATDFSQLVITNETSLSLGAGVKVDYGGGVFFIAGVTALSLDASDFIFL